MPRDYFLIAFASMLLLSACASRAHVRNGLPAARCLEGVAYGIDTLAAHDAPQRRDKIWLVLGGGASGEGGGRGANVILQKNSIRYQGDWRTLGDSILVRQNTFPSVQWILYEELGELRGCLHTESDFFAIDPRGNVVKQRADWPAVFTEISCDAVSKPPNTR